MKHSQKHENVTSTENEKQAVEITFEDAQTLDLADNVFKNYKYVQRTKGNHVKKLKEGMMTVSYQFNNINKEKLF